MTTPVVVQVSTLSTSGAPSLAASTAGNALILVAGTWGGALPDSSFSATGFTEQVNTGVVGSAANNQTSAGTIQHQTNIAGGPVSVSVTGPGGNYGVSAYLIEVSGLDATPGDLAVIGAQQTVPSSGGSFSVPLTGTAAAAGELAVALLTSPYGNTTSVFDTPTGFTADPQQTSASYAIMAGFHEIASGTSIDGTLAGSYPSGNYSGYFGGVLASFKAAASGNALAADIAAQPEVLGSMRASQSLYGAATIYPFAGAQFRQVNAALALASVSPAMEGSAQARQQGAGSSVAQPVVQGAAQAIQRLAAGVSLQPAVSGSFTIKSSAVSLTGAITVQPGVSGAMTARQGFAGTILLQPEVSGVLTISQPGIVSLVGAIAVQPGMAGYLSARQSAAGSVTAPARAAGSFAGINALAGSARALPSVAGAWLGFLGLSTGIPAPYAARGTAYAWQPLQGDVILQPDISGSIHPPFAGYPVDPHYYAIQPARFFYASMLLRAFYAAQPFRSFYALCNPDMAVQIPYAIDPGETKVITLDATADLPSGVTLTGTPTVQIAVYRGVDPNAASHFTGAAINTQQITVQTATGSQTIAAGLAVQLIASGCVDGCWYEIRLICQTSSGENVEVLKAILMCTAS